MITQEAWEAIEQTGERGGRYGWTWPKTWAAIRRAWLKADPCPDGGNLPAGWFDPADDDDAKAHGQQAWHEGRRISNRTYVDLI